MRIVAIILALFVAFPNMGYALTSTCCSLEETQHDSCDDDTLDMNQESENSKEEQCPCDGQCDCSCCTNTFLIKDEISNVEKIESSISKTSPLSPGTAFRLGFYNLIWRPPQVG